MAAQMSVLDCIRSFYWAYVSSGSGVLQCAFSASWVIGVYVYGEMEMAMGRMIPLFWRSVSNFCWNMYLAAAWAEIKSTRKESKVTNG